jgi:HPt (histidine-containing phosphotransfer) domain-containing protein
MADSGQPEIAGALKLLWHKFLPQMQERVAVFEAAARALKAESLSSEQQTAAAAAAHKLAGVLGTFGLAEGSDLAHEAEDLYISNALPESATAQRAERIANRLAELIQIHQG